ncbi:uncharacterized protein METZ01_LOCUS83323 [marine metagenome]|uniref:Uncharacterized protein n=1 Tax=marine metagenome TaxID=408172 RepID=A0A381UQN3_9ZZZZ
MTYDSMTETRNQQYPNFLLLNSRENIPLRMGFYIGRIILSHPIDLKITEA